MTLIERLKALSGGEDCLIRLALVEIESLRQQLSQSNRCLRDVKEACLYSEDDGSIGVTQEPHVSSHLFDEICKTLAATEPES